MARKPSLLYVSCSEIDRRTGSAVNELESIRGMLNCDSGFQVFAIAAYRSNPNVAPDLSTSVLTRVRGHSGRPCGVLGYWWRMLCAILKVARRHDVDLIVYRMSPAPLTELLIYLLTRRPFAVKTWKDPADFLSGRFGVLKSVAVRFSRSVERLTLRRALFVDVQSNAWAERLHDVHGIPHERIFIMPNGANARRFARSLGSQLLQHRPASRARLVFAGGFGQVYELDALVDAVYMLDPDQRNFEIVIAGAGPGESELKARVEQLALSNHFNFLGWVEYQQLPELFWNCDCGIDLSAVPLTKGSSARTFISQKTAQYLFAGLPVIAWDIDGAEFLREQSLGWVAPYRSIEQLAHVLVTAADSARRGEALEIGQRAMDFAVRERSQESIAARRCKIYRQALRAA